MVRLGSSLVRAPVHKAGDMGSNPGPDKIFFSEINNCSYLTKNILSLMHKMALSHKVVRFLKCTSKESF